MKRKILVLFCVFIIGFLSGVLSTKRRGYNDEKLLHKLYEYVLLIENVEFRYLKIKGNKMFYTPGDLSRLDQHMDGRIKAKEVGEIDIPAQVQGKTKGVNVRLVYKLDKQIYFMLSGFINHEYGVLYTKSSQVTVHSRYGISPLFVFKGNGYWYSYAN